jgi:Glyoxalase-like domain
VLADPEGNELCVLDPRERYLNAGPLAAIVLDAIDPEAVGPFWSAATGWPISFRDHGIVTLHHPTGRPPDIDIVRVEAPKEVKNRLHLDVAPFVGGSIPVEVQRLLALGATPAEVGQRDVPWTVLADPEGNELCVLTPR